MKVQVLRICAVLVAVSFCCAGYARTSVKPAKPAMKVVRTSGKAATKMTAQNAIQPSLSGTMPSATTPAIPNAANVQSQPGMVGSGPGLTAPTIQQPGISGNVSGTLNQPGIGMAPGQGAFTGQPQSGAIVGQPAPGAVGAGPAAVGGAPIAMTTDNTYLYVMQGGMIYRYPKANISAAGFPVTAGVGAGPTCPTCTGISYIPGYPAQQYVTATTTTPCPPGCGPSQTIVKCTSCGQPVASPCPTPAPVCPAPCPAPQPQPSSCDPCAPACPQPTSVSYSTTMPASAGAGPCSTCPPVAAVSACGQTTVQCLQGLCGAEADKAYLQALIQINQQVLALSNNAAIYLGTTFLQDYATNSIGDSTSRINQSAKWLKTKYCTAITTCTPGLSSSLNICATSPYGREFDDAYRAQLVQYYVDEIAISQVEVERGLDSQVKALAARVISEDQERIRRLTRCNTCI